METLRLKAQVRPGGTVEWPDLPSDLPPEEVEVILLHPTSEAGRSELGEEATPADWPRLEGGTWKEKSLRRTDLYGKDGR